ncbi:MAG: dephospho-CoA kinase, partial [Candidatus Acidiferrales bacterium]
MLTVGLTGGIASGKSTVARLFQQRGCASSERAGRAQGDVLPG